MLHLRVEQSRRLTERPYGILFPFLPAQFRISFSFPPVCWYHHILILIRSIYIKGWVIALYINKRGNDIHHHLCQDSISFHFSNYHQPSIAYYKQLISLSFAIKISRYTTGTTCQHQQHQQHQNMSKPSKVITEIEGDLFEDSPENSVLIRMSPCPFISYSFISILYWTVIASTDACNCQGSWGKGIAKAFKEKVRML